MTKHASQSVLFVILKRSFYLIVVWWRNNFVQFDLPERPTVRKVFFVYFGRDMMRVLKITQIRFKD